MATESQHGKSGYENALSAIRRVERMAVAVLYLQQFIHLMLVGCGSTQLGLAQAVHGLERDLHIMPSRSPPLYL
jgi:hypothetical protein